MNGRPAARAIVALALIGLAWLALGQIEISYLPTQSFPEIQVRLELADPYEIDDVAWRFVEPIESAARSLGGVRAVTGEIHTRGADLRIHLGQGEDPWHKAARLDSELGRLARRLPADSTLETWPFRQAPDEWAYVLWLETDDTIDPLLVMDFERCPEVRSVSHPRSTLAELWLRNRAATISTPRLTAAVARRSQVERYGALDVAGRSVELWTEPADAWIGRLPIGLGTSGDRRPVVPLAMVAEPALETRDPAWRLQVDGRDGQALLLFRQDGVSPLAFTNAVERVIRAHGMEGRSRVLYDQAASLRLLLWRLALGLAAAALAMTVLGFLHHGILGGWLAIGRLAVAVAAAVLGLWLGNMPFDATTLPMASIAVAVALLASALHTERRDDVVYRVHHLIAAALLPASVALAGGPLAPVLGVPATAFASALGAAILGMAILPPAPFPRRDGSSPVLRSALRLGLVGPAVVGAVIWLVLALGGEALAPRPGQLSPALHDLVVDATFAEGATLAEATRRSAEIAAVVRSFDEVTDTWTFVTAEHAVMSVTVDPTVRQRRALATLGARFERRLGTITAATRVVPFASGTTRLDEPLRFSSDPRERASVDDDMLRYRLLLRGRSLAALERAEQRVSDRLRQLVRQTPRRSWPEPSPVLAIEPLHATDTATAMKLSERLTRYTLVPDRLAEHTPLGVASLTSPRNREQLPSRREIEHLLAAEGDTGPVVVSSYARTTRATRDTGRFVLGLEVEIPGTVLAGRSQNAAELASALRALALPEGIDLELPAVDGFDTEERLRLVLAAGLLPLLLLTLTAIRVDSLERALPCLLPLGTVIATGVLVAGRTLGAADEPTLLALGATLCGIAVVAAEIANRSSTRLEGAAESYRWLAPRARYLLTPVLPWSALLVVPGIGLAADRYFWIAPLRTAGLSGVAGLLVAVYVMPVLLSRLSRRATRTVEMAPAAWRPPVASVTLEARNLVKIYGGPQGHRGLDGVSFHLTPGIVGLLGPNGAGKTSLLRILSGLIDPSRGQLFLNGVRVNVDNRPAYRRAIGFLPQDFNAYEGFSGARFLDYWALEMGMIDRRERRREVERVLAEVGLEAAAGRNVRGYSGGMRRRIGIARALLGSPPVLLLDEPTAGLDVESRERLRDTMLGVARSRLVVFSTHIASDVAATASKLLIIQAGKVVFDGTVDALIEAARGRVFALELEPAEVAEMGRRHRVTTRVTRGERVHVRVVAARGELDGEAVEPSLEEAYLVRVGDDRPTLSRTEATDDDLFL